ncbi:tRNA (adenine(22)-N(1))-methyltransferase [Paenibacillus sp. SYP-B4298]|uniref:tRNA (adenine(22)-N(1))-methyltransferase n=1 Tax=Paenibacillus sp. SYP-B4298 TaxID=2996034 RepID=UPI0022DCEDAF|nr:class I SAM-dependent methyltransferase [Paenibacillus sp. SYP-B4298]
MITLSKRLDTIASLVSSQHRVADIGSDHALLPVYLLQSGKCPAAIAGELNEGPYKAACRQVAAAGLQQKIQVRQGNGLDVLHQSEADTITIAGMGGGLIRDILESGRAAGKLEGVRELVLQPNVGEELVRRWLVAHHWVLQAERIVLEDGKIYEIMHATSAKDVQEAAEANGKLYHPGFWEQTYGQQLRPDLVYMMGPWLMRQPDAVWSRKWQGELAKLEHIQSQLSRSDLPESREKLVQLQQDMNEIKEVLACLQTDTPSFN